VRPDTVSVERFIKAQAREIFALLADAGRHASFDGSGTLDHADADSIPLELGTTFSMRMRGRPETLFLPYSTTNEVIEFEPDRRIAWQPTSFGGLVGGRIWRYELIPTVGAETSATSGTGGTLVRETWDVSRGRLGMMLKVSGMARQAEDGMRATLARIAALLES
jgi:uncharacterized protein YndB with AHSA1/START domain